MIASTAGFVPVRGTCGGAIPDTADYRVVTDGEPVLAR